MEIAEFLQHVITTPEGWFCLSLQSSQTFENAWFRWPDELPGIVKTAQVAAPVADVHFNPRLFKAQKATKENALDTQTLSVDLDYADPLRLPIQPTVLLHSSAGRHQAHWKCSELLTPLEFEPLSKKLTYAIENADPSGWTINHKFRLPQTLNHKYDPAQEVYVTECTGRAYGIGDLELLPEPPPVLSVEYDDFIASEPQSNMGPQEMLESIKGKIPAKVYTSYNLTMSDRSSALWALMCSAFRAGLNREQVFYLAYHSANNKFKEQRANGLRDLAKDVLRAERQAQSIEDDAREIIAAIRKLGGNQTERFTFLKDTVIDLMRKSGQFVATDDDITWYIPSASGVPISISRQSSRLSMLLDTKFGLNATEREHQYVMAGVTAFSRTLPTTGTIARMAYYDRPTNTVLVHTGRRDVLRIASSNISIVPNGSFGVVFPWLPNVEPFAPMVPSANVPSCWADSLFSESLTNVANMSPEEAYSLLRVWLLFMMFRNDASARPIIALFGQPGSGKTTLMSKIYTMLYGRKLELSKITTPEDFDMAVSKYPVTVFDQVDTYERWLPDRLAAAAKNTKSTRRKLYTDDDVISISGTAMIGVTAHDPRFTRADVVDRLVVLAFRRIDDFMPEGSMMQDVYQRRNILWGHLVSDVQRILATPRPTSEPTELRSADLVDLGRWFTKALGGGTQFEAAIKALVKAQHRQALADDGPLVHALLNYTKDGKHDGQWRATGAIWMEMSMTGDTSTFLKRYKDAPSLDKRLYVLQGPLNDLVDIQWRDGLGSREWMINARS